MTDVPTLRSAAEAVSYLLQCDHEIDTLEARLSDVKSRRRKVEVEVGPDLFDRADVKSVELPNGAKAVKKMFVEGSLPKPGEKDSDDVAARKQAKRDAAIAWAISDDVGWGPFVKTTITASFDKGDHESAMMVLNYLRGLNSGQPTIKVEEGIHPKTLQSQALKRLQSGRDLPLEDLGLTALTGIKITKRPKED